MWSDRSDQIDSLSAALIKALGEIHDLPKTQTANVGKFAYSYATLADALQMARPVFAARGLAVTQTAATVENEVAIYTTIIHESGQFVTTQPLTMPIGKTAQETGSAITYGRRYALMAVLGLATEDDDGASAAPRLERSASQRQPKPAAPRTNAESEIRSMIASLDKVDAAELKQVFVSEFGCSLVDLHPDAHEDALFMVRSWIDKRDEIVVGGD